MRQAMPGIIVLLVAGHHADAASYRIASPMTACIDPRSTLLLQDARVAAQHPAAWLAAMQRHGHCVAVQPGARWERILGSGALLLLRRTPPIPGLPPLYFPAGSESLVPDNPAETAASGELDAVAQPEPAARISATDAPPIGDDDQISTEPLPAPASDPSTSIPPPLTETLPMPATQGDADTSLMDITANSANLERAMQQGYAVGFVATMLLIGLLVAVVAGIVWTILRNARLSREAALPILGSHAAAGLSPVLAAGRLPARRVARNDETRRLETTQVQPSPVLALPELALPPVAPPPPADAADFRSHCIGLLDAAGWQTSVRPVAAQAMPDVVAERNGRVLALQCLPAMPAIDEEAIDRACMARERQQADSAAIVSNASFTAPAKRLALQTGIVLLHADELAAFAA